MSLKGNIKELDISDFCLLAGNQQKNGYLVLSNHSDRFVIKLRRGVLRTLIQQRNGRSITFLDHLLRYKYINLDHFSRIKRVLKSSAHDISDILTAETDLTADKIRRTAENYVKMNMVEMLGWEEGEFEFTDVLCIYSRYEVDVRLRMEDVILSCLQEIDEIKAFHPDLASFKLVLKLNTDFKFFEELDEESIRFLNALDGRLNLHEVADVLKIHPYLAMEAAMELLDRGCIEAGEKKDGFKQCNTTERNGKDHEIDPLADEWAGSLLSNFQTAVHLAGLYPERHPRMQEAVRSLLLDMREPLRKNGNVAFSIAGSNILLNDRRLTNHRIPLKNFHQIMTLLRIEKIIFYEGITFEMMMDVVRILGDAVAFRKSKPSPFKLRKNKGKKGFKQEKKRIPRYVRIKRLPPTTRLNH